MDHPPTEPGSGAVDLYWLPLGAGPGGGLVRASGRVFEAVAARRRRREPLDLFHSALEVEVDGVRHAVEMAPVWAQGGGNHGAVVVGPVGARPLGRWRWFRYEVRRWHDGVIPDLAAAVASPRRVSSDRARALQVLALVPLVPALTWGRDELRAGEMWNSNSLVSWLLARSGHDVARIGPPPHGRAPGWTAGLVAAQSPGLPGSRAEGPGGGATFGPAGSGPSAAT
jgi:hypothetical protein